MNEKKRKKGDHSFEWPPNATSYLIKSIDDEVKSYLL